MIDALTPWIERGVPVVGLEPSCLYSLKDEFLAMHPGDSRADALAELAVTFESFVAARVQAKARRSRGARARRRSSWSTAIATRRPSGPSTTRWPRFARFPARA